MATSKKQKHYLHKTIEWTKSKQEEFAAKPLPEGEENNEEREEIQAQIKQYTAMEAQLLMMGSKLDRRRQDIYRARDRSKAAQKSSKILEKMSHWLIVLLNKVFWSSWMATIPSR